MFKKMGRAWRDEQVSGVEGFIGMTNSEKLLDILNELRKRRSPTGSIKLNDAALGTIHREANHMKEICFWLGFLRGIVSSDGILTDELEPLILHTEEFLRHFPDEDADELLNEICNDWPDVSEEAEGIIENILEFRDENVDLSKGYNASNYFSGFMKGIACDNIISSQEVDKTLAFLSDHPEILKEPKVKDIRDQMISAMDDGHISTDESEELCSWISRLVGDSFADTGLSSCRDKAATEEFEKELQISDLVGSSVVVTGVFSGRLTRRQIVAALSAHGVEVVQSVTKKVTHLIVADEASRHWARTNAGTKLMAADKLRQNTGQPKLVSEMLLLQLL
jgi:hypothetical protein